MPRVYSKRAGAEPAPPDAVYVGRPTKWGNPIPLDDVNNDEERREVLRNYEAWLMRQPALMAAMRKELRGRDLVCWCAPRTCHADVILRVANEGLVRVVAPKFVAGLIVDVPSRRITRAAPILRRLVRDSGDQWDEFRKRAKAQRWVLEVLD